MNGLDAFGGQPPSSLLAPDHAGVLTKLDWDAHWVVSEAIAAQVLADPGLRQRFLACNPTGDGVACLKETVVRFGRRAFRRPLSSAELGRFERIIEQGTRITARGALEEVAEVLLQTFLISPSFLQRSELVTAPGSNGTFVLSAHEVASRLSYMLWGSTPDEVLEAAADAGELVTPEQIRSHASRMLKDPRAREVVTSFHDFYLGRGPNSHWERADKDAKLFPHFNQAVVSAMNAETDRFFDAIVFEQRGTFRDLLESPVGFVNADTAPLYGVTSKRLGPELEQITLDPIQRPGFLTRLHFLATHAQPERSSPIRRGVFIALKILGQDLAPPDPSALSTPLPPGDWKTNRERVTAQTSASGCAECHSLYIDPAGFALEAYDAIGAWQTVEAATEAPIDTAAVVFIDGTHVRVQGPADLMAKIAESKEAQRRYVERWVTYAYARHEPERDACVVNALAKRLRAPDYSVLDLITDLTQTQSFRLRAREVTP